ncbi:MAG: hypothetical protein HY350_02925, partial [Candidatus Omnitrophica bacterium]|nr:hypothetical protein [Candidatus Omnitrophota bacterium]
MQSLSNTKIKITDMAKLVLWMWEKTNEAFMKHDLDLLPTVIDAENKVNNFEKEIIAELVQVGR